MLIPPTVLPSLALPARSVAGSLVTLWSAPLPLTSLSLGQLATPDRLSVQLKPTTTSPLYQPAAFGAVFGPPLITGAVRSILIPLTEAEALLPGLVGDADGPGAEVCALAGDRRCRPARSPGRCPRGRRPPSTDRDVVLVPAGRVRVGGRGAGQARSRQVDVDALDPCRWPSCPRCRARSRRRTGPRPRSRASTGSVQPAMPDSASEQSKATVTGPLFQPKPLASGSAAARDRRRRRRRSSARASGPARPCPRRCRPCPRSRT